jgi:hypothetical protein
MKKRTMAKAFRTNPWGETQLRLAKWYAKRTNEGAHGMKGGWLYKADMTPIAQGWDSYYIRRKKLIWAAIEELGAGN